MKTNTKKTINNTDIMSTKLKPITRISQQRMALAF
jgi:hypothetical protein